MPPSPIDEDLAEIIITEHKAVVQKVQRECIT